MRRIAAAIVLSLAAVAGADACSVSRDYERPAAFAQYDDTYQAWFDALADKLKRDPDPEVAYAGYLLTGHIITLGPPPPPPDEPPGVAKAEASPQEALPIPTTGLARALRMAYCSRAERCDDGVAAWIAAEPDNAFALAHALARHRRGKIPDVEHRLAQATRYDDYFAAMIALPAKIAVRYDTTPPPAPAGYATQPCAEPDKTSVASAMSNALLHGLQPNHLMFVYDDTMDAAARLRAADLMIAAKNTPLAGEFGVRIGVAAASEPADRERYCRLQARFNALPMRYASGTEAAALKRRYYAALETRTGLDAAETVAREAAGGVLVKPPDEAVIAACVLDVRTGAGEG